MEKLSTRQLMEKFLDMEAAKNMNMLEVKLIDMGVFGDELEQRMTSRAYELQKEKERILGGMYSGGIVDLIGVTQ